MKLTYDDIIHLPHHVSKRHRPMSLEKRAAQFAPFAALTGYDAAIDETARHTDSFVEIESDAALSLDQKIMQLQALLESPSEKGLPTVTLTYFKPDSRKSGGSYETLQGEVKRIDASQREILMKNGTHVSVPKIVDLFLEE